MQLSKTFTLSELTYSNIARARGIDNTLPPYLMPTASVLSGRLSGSKVVLLMEGCYYIL